MGFGTNDRTVYDLLNDKMYIVNANQRKYVWENSNWRELLEDMDLVLNHKSDKHFIGSVILKEEHLQDGIKNHYSVIDGQQRISTLTIMLCSLAYIFAEKDMIEEFKGLEKHLFVTDNRNKSFPIVSEKANPSISSLVCELYNSANKHFLENCELVNPTELLKATKNCKRIKDCFMFFYSEFSERTSEETKRLLDYRDILLDICYIDIIAEEDEDAYNIFEVLNARGLPLTDFELLRNYLLRYSEEGSKDTVKDQLSELENLLGDDAEVFLKHYAMHKYGSKTDKSENRPYKVITKKEKNNISNLIEDLLLKAKYYKKMTEYKDCSPLEKKVFSFFKPRRQQQFRPIVMGLMHQYELNNLDLTQYEKYLEYLYEFFICFFIIGEQTSNKIEDVVYGYSSKIENEFNKDVLLSFKKSMAERIPSRENFINAIKRIRYSHKFKAYSESRKRDNVFAIYELLEKELGYEGTFEDINIEHCNPDSESEENAHIGNQMLLEKSINEDCKGKPLAQKIELYDQSSLKYPKILREKYLINNGLLDYDKNCDFIAEVLFKRIKNLSQI